jgi:hypothetical protein
VQHVAARDFREPRERYVSSGHGLLIQGPLQVDALGLIDETLQSADFGDPRMVLNRVRLYREGVCEWVRRYAPHRQRELVPSTSFAKDTYNALCYFASVYERLDYAGRVAVFIRIDDADEAELGVDTQLGRFATGKPAAMEAVGVLKETSVDALLLDPLPLLRESMDVIWQAFGYPDAWLFGEDGQSGGEQVLGRGVHCYAPAESRIAQAAEVESLPPALASRASRCQFVLPSACDASP